MISVVLLIHWWTCLTNETPFLAEVLNRVWCEMPVHCVHSHPVSYAPGNFVRYVSRSINGKSKATFVEMSGHGRVSLKM